MSPRRFPQQILMVGRFNLEAGRRSSSYFLSLLAVTCLCVLIAGTNTIGKRQINRETAKARQNPILRDYFRTRIVEMRGVSAWPKERFIDHFVDLHIDNYVLDLLEKLDLLKANSGRLDQAGGELQRTNSSDGLASPRMRYVRALEEIETAAEEARKMLGRVFTKLASREAFEPQITADGRQSAYENERQYLSDQIQKAERKITQYLFGSTNVVQLQDLQGETMLIHLYRIEEMAKKLKQIL